MANDAYDFLRAFLPYKLLDDAQVDRLSRRAKTDSHPFGHIIFNEGDQSDAVYVVKSGHIKIFTEDQSGNQVTLVTLEEGDSFGELGVIQNAHRSTSARAAKDVELVRIDKEDFCELWKDSPVIRANFEKFFDNYAMRSFLRRYTSLGKIPPKVLNKLLSHFKLRPVHEGELVMNEGDEADAYFIIHEGVFEVHQNGKRINVLSNGEGFGERALLSGDQRSASVVAKTGGELYVLFREDFIDSLATVPDIYNILAQLQVEDLDKPALEDVPPAVKTLRQDDGESEKDEEPPPPAHLDPYGVPRIRKLLPFPSIRQYDETDCGAACLAMISQYYGKRMSMGRLRDLANVTTEGASFASLSIAGEALGYSTRGIRTSFQKLKAIHLPAIAHWEDYHYIVVWKITKTHVTIGDPAIGRKKLTIAEFEEGWTGYVLEFLPTSELLDVKSSMTAFNRFAPLLRPHKRLIFDIFLCSLLLDIFGLAQPLFTQVVVDKVFVHDARGLLDALLVGMVLLAVLTAITSALRRSLLVYISTKVDLRLISEFLRHMVRLPMKYFDSRRVGDIMPRVDENEAITRAFVGTIPTAILDMLMASTYLIIMALYSVELTAMLIVSVCLFGIITVGFTPAIRANAREVFARQADAESYLIESVSGVATVKALAIENQVRWKWENLFSKSVLETKKGAGIDIWQETISTLLMATSSTIIFWYGATLVLEGEMSLGQLFAFNILVSNVTAPMMGVIKVWDELVALRISLDRLNDVFDSKTEDHRESTDATKLLAIPKIHGQIKFENVVFKYDPDVEKPVLSNLTMEIPAGSNVALVGRSGSGKTTLSKLIFGFYPILKGRVLIDGHDIRNLEIASLRSNIGVVPQEVVLFSGTIRENIALGHLDTSLEKVIAAAQLAGADEFICEMPLGYDTMTGERGTSLSGGQRQRIAIARAILRDPAILIFDEATSALDTESEKAIQRNMESLSVGRTTIMIAHRLSTIRRADIIFVMDKGALIEHGSHNELLERRGLYHYLVTQQSLG